MSVERLDLMINALPDKMTKPVVIFISYDIYTKACEQLGRKLRHYKGMKVIYKKLNVFNDSGIIVTKQHWQAMNNTFVVRKFMKEVVND